VPIPAPTRPLPFLSVPFTTEDVQVTDRPLVLSVTIVFPAVPVTARPVMQPPTHGPSCLASPLPPLEWRWPLPASTIYGGVLDGAVLVALAPVMLLACQGLPAPFRPRPVTNARAYSTATTINRNR
jgi:hypothetical protein